MKGLMNLFTLVCAPAESETIAAATVRQRVFVRIFLFFIYSLCAAGRLKRD
jgi:hypothetical protein